MTIDRLAHPALVVVDMQNDFVRVGAPLEVPEARATIPVQQTLIDTCRELGIPVIYTKFLAGPERILLWEWSPVHAPPVCSCWKGVALDYPDVDREKAIVLSRVPELSETLAEQVVRLVRSIRELELKKAPSIAETLDWARTLLHLSITTLDDDTLKRTMPVLLKYQSDITKATDHLNL